MKNLNWSLIVFLAVTLFGGCGLQSMDEDDAGVVDGGTVEPDGDTDTGPVWECNDVCEIPDLMYCPEDCDDPIEVECDCDCCGEDDCDCPDCPEPQPECGDQQCDDNEDCESCPGDCGQCPEPEPECGDEQCNGNETCSTCPGDCGECGPECGDQQCNGDEDCSSCPSDCGSCCGNGQCDNGESCCSCEEDCGECETVPLCGDTVCNGTETYNTCPCDCPLPDPFEHPAANTFNFHSYYVEGATEGVVLGALAHHNWNPDTSTITIVDDDGGALDDWMGYSVPLGTYAAGYYRSTFYGWNGGSGDWADYGHPQLMAFMRPEALEWLWCSYIDSTGAETTDLRWADGSSAGSTAACDISFDLDEDGNATPRGNAHLVDWRAREGITCSG